MDHFVGRFATSEDCHLLPKRGRLVGSEKYRFWFGESLVGVVELFARQVLINPWDIQGEKSVQHAAKVLLLALHGIK